MTWTCLKEKIEGVVEKKVAEAFDEKFERERKENPT